MASYPIYIIDTSEGVQIVFPKGKQDLNHADFWSDTVADLVVEFGCAKKQNLKNLKNAPYCMRRARVTSNGVVYYGEEQTDELLNQIKQAVGEPDLRWSFDEHESRIEFDQSILESCRQLLPNIN